MKLIRVTLYPNLDVKSVGPDFQEIKDLCGDYDSVSANIFVLADHDTIFEIAQTMRGPMRQLDRGEWHPDWYLHP